ncbi:UNVERIFIED_ORG: hypothetical protein M2382_002910 [Enterobacter sp. BIGb0239]
MTRLASRFGAVNLSSPWPSVTRPACAGRLLMTEHQISLPFLAETIN